MTSKLQAIFKAKSFASIGSCMRSRLILVLIGCLNQIDHPRQRTRRIASGLLQILNGWQALIRIKVCIHGRHWPVTLRAEDLGDYQSAFECLGSMYQPPELPVRYLLDGGERGFIFSAARARFPSIEESVIVEPDPDNLIILKLNIASIGNVSLEACALAKQRGVSKFHRKASNMGYLVDDDGVGLEGNSTYAVETRRLAEVLPPHWKPESLWLKLDIEGAEYEVFDEILAQGVKPAVISAELHDITRHGGERLMERLREEGYKVVVQGSGPQEVVDRQYSHYTQKRN